MLIRLRPSVRARRSKMIPDSSNLQKDREPQEEPVSLSDFRPPEAHHSVILVADDNALVRNVVTLLMQKEGHFVLSAADGHEGLELSRKYPGTIDLVITDVEMPRAVVTAWVRSLAPSL